MVRVLLWSFVLFLVAIPIVVLCCYRKYVRRGEERRGGERRGELEMRVT